MKTVVTIIAVLAVLIALALWLRHEDNRITKEREEGGTGLVVVLSIAGVIVVVGVSLLIYFLVYATANVRGRAAVHNTVLSGQSRLELTRHFHDLYATIQAQQEQAYKDIDQVMADQTDLVEIVHTLRQVFNYKGT